MGTQQDALLDAMEQQRKRSFSVNNSWLFILPPNLTQSGKTDKRKRNTVFKPHNLKTPSPSRSSPREENRPPKECHN